MEPLNDDELRGLLRQWQAPDAPPSLDAKVLGARRQDRWWKWLLTGSIRIPVPVGILAASRSCGFCSSRLETVRSGSEFRELPARKRTQTKNPKELL